MTLTCRNDRPKQCTEGIAIWTGLENCASIIKQFADQPTIEGNQLIQTEKIARRLRDNWQARRPYETMAGEFAIGSVANAYAVQLALQHLHEADRGAVGGRKIALSSRTMQQMIGIDQPIAAAMFSGDIVNSPATIKITDFVRLGLEFELAIELNSDISPQTNQHTAESVYDHIAGVRPAFELIEDRDADYTNLDALTLIADNGWCGGVVLGEKLENWRELDLANIASVVRQVGQPDEHTNTGAADPLGSLAWVLNHFSGRGIALSKGEHIITGSAVRTRFPLAGDRLAYQVGEASVELQVI